jgi:NAD(P)-dependent dehydrogenase (short-subunit alcohol dehydrogenase family)
MSIAVVTGAARGIGAATAERLLADGFEVIGLDLEASLSSAPQVAYPLLACDVADPASVAAVAERVGVVEVLVNNAGSWSFDPLEDLDPVEFARVLMVNLAGTFHCTQAFGRSMLATGLGSIVNIVSIAAAAANPQVGAYSASKAGVLALTRQTALEWGPRGVRANAVGPGLIPTPGTGTVYEDAEVRAVRSRAVPLRRLGTAEDVAATVSFLCSPAAAYVTAQVIYVDGGLGESLMTQLPRPGTLPGPHLDERDV